MRIIGLLVCGEGEADRYLERVLEEFKRLCDDAIICGNRIDLKSRTLIKKYKFKFLEDDREWGEYQPKIKERLLRCSAYLKPDWCVFLDADEVFESSFTREKAEKMASVNDICYTSWFLELWDSENQYREDLTFESVRFFKFIPSLGFAFKGTPLHCGNVPEKVGKWATYSDIFIFHYGLLEEKERKRKYERYMKYDPEGKWMSKDWYEALLSKNPPLKSLSELPKVPATKFRKRMPYTKEGLEEKQRIAQIKGQRIWRFLNPHGVVITIDKEKHYQEMKLRNGFQFLGEDVVPDNYGPVLTADVPVISDPLQCGICGYVGKNAQALRMHKMKRKHNV